MSAALQIWPTRVRVFRVPVGGRALVDTRIVGVGLLLTVAILALGTYALTLGESDIPLADVWAAVTGQAGQGTTRIVLEWRLPRIAIAVFGGAALGMSGAIFQSMTRNPLGSPDIIGFNMGAYTGALVAGTVLAAGAAAVTFGALIGGLVTAGIVYLLAFKGGLLGFRLIVVGIAVSAMLNAFNAWLLVRASAESAVSAAFWGQGSLNGVRWPDVIPVIWSIVILVPLALLLVRRLDLLELGDDFGRLLGVRPERTRLGMLAIGVGLIAVVTAIVGPITFVALAAPQIARRLVQAAGPLLPSAALMGALLLLASDIIAQRLIAPSQLPVGVVTACLGGGYLLWIMSRSRKGA